ncbi:dienelactone hydrolase family protein [Pseudomonas sp. REB1044]
MKTLNGIMGSLMLMLATQAPAAMVAKPIAYTVDALPFEGYLVYDDAQTAARPGLMMVPNWMGVTPNAIDKAKLVAGKQYVVFVSDIFGKDIRPANASEAEAAATKVRSDRASMRKIAQAAVDVLKGQKLAAVDNRRVAAIGFCLGGTSILELARSGADLKAFVSFHGNLDTPNPADANHIKAPVLVLHGADDPTVSESEIRDFIKEMKAAPNVDWQFVAYSNTVHSFTNPDAKVPGKYEYNPRTAARSYKAMNDLLDEQFSAVAH